MASKTDKSCYAAFEIEDVENDESYYGALKVTLVNTKDDLLVDDYELNADYDLVRPYTAKEDAKTLLTAVPASAGAGYEATTDLSKATPYLNVKRQNGEYVQWEINANLKFEIIPKPATTYSEAGWKNLEVIATVMGTNQDGV